MPADWNRFDFRAVSLFSRSNRTEPLYREFNRVGLTDVTPFWTGPNPYERVIESQIPHTRMCSGTFLNITLKHLNMVRVAYDRGFRHPLFFEDDIRFLKDREKLGEILADLPEDYDVALLDWVPRFHADAGEIGTVLRQDGLWHRFRDLRSCAAYSLSRKGMEKYLSILESPASGSGKLKICDQHWWETLRDGTLKGYCAVPNVGVQGVPGGNSGYERMWGQYAKINIRRKDYAD